MLRFASTPDKLVAQCVKCALEHIINFIDAVEMTDENPIYNLTTDEFKMFGNDARIIRKILASILVASESSIVYMPTDYHFLLLDRVLQDFNAEYTDCIAEEPLADLCSEYQKLRKLMNNFDWREDPKDEDEDNTPPEDVGEYIIECYFWDTDYDMLPEAFGLDPGITAFSDTAFGAANRMEPAPEELMFTEYIDKKLGKAVNLIK